MSEAHTNNFNDQEAIQQTFEDLARAGFQPPRAPELGVEEMPWPSALCNLTSNELSVQMAHWTGWYTYALSQLAQARSNRESLDRQMKRFESRELAQTSGSTVAAKKSVIHSSEEFIEMEARYEYFAAKTEMLHALTTTYEARYNAVSREMTRRKDDLR